MEDYEDTGPSESELRWKGRRGWLVFAIIVGVAAYLAGHFYVLSQAECPRFQELLLIVSVAIGTIIGLAMLYFGSDAFQSQIISLVLIATIGIGFPILFGGVLSSQQFVRAQFCPICGDDLARSETQRQKGILEGAEQLARKCTVASVDSTTKTAAERQLVLVLDDRAGKLLEYRDCVESGNVLLEAEALAKTYSDSDPLKHSLQNRRSMWSLLCVPTATPLPTFTPYPTPVPPPSDTPVPPPSDTPVPSPTPVVDVEILRSPEHSGVIDFRVFVNAQALRGLKLTDIQVRKSSGEAITVQALEERKEQDPVCMVAVVDNSGSIKPTVQQIRDALSALNRGRIPQPNAELGMVVFGTDIQKQIAPATADLDVMLIDAGGGNTRLWDSVQAGIDLTQQCKAPALSRYVFVMTDGDDNSSIMLGDNMQKARDVRESARQKGTFICTIGITSPDLVEAPLREAVHQCFYQTAVNTDALATTLKNLFNYATDFYRLRIEPEQHTGQIILSVMGMKEELVDTTSK